MLPLVCLSLLAIATAESCFDVGQGYTGKDIKHVPDSETPADCQVKCQNTEGCVAWTHDTRERHKNKPRSYKHKGCWLHHGKGPRWSSPDAVSGPKFCPRPADPGCYEGDGKFYAGKVYTSKSGKTCQRWTSQTPHEHFFWNPTQKDPNNYPDNSVEEAANYCRNPDGADAPYCYTMDEGTRWELCDIPKCAAPTTVAPTTVAPTTVAPTTVAPTTVAPVPEIIGLKYKERCNSRSPPCGEANTECRAYRCFCKGGYERSGDECVAQDTLPLGHRCSAQGARCADANSQCRGYRCFCKSGFAKSGTQCV